MAQYAGEIADLMHATGPATYEYQFDGRALFDHIVNASWPTRGTLFGYDAATLALDGEVLLGIEVGFPGPEFKPRKKALASFWPRLIKVGEVTAEQLSVIGERSYLCSYLNAAIPAQAYYLHALAVKDGYRGRRIGATLLLHAIEQAKQAGLRALHLDVLSDARAVDFYRSMGMACLVESTAPVPLQAGVPMEMRMAIDFGQ